MFALSRYLAAPCPASPAPAGPDEFRSRAYRFVGSHPDLRLPKDPSELAGLLDGPDGPVAHAVLDAPVERIALADHDGCRRAALVAAVTAGTGTVLASVRLVIRPGANKHQQPDLVSASLETAPGREAMIDLLAALWHAAHPTARAAAKAAQTVWLGTDPRDPASSLPADAAAVGAAYGLDVEVVRDANRRAREVATRLSGEPPDYVIVWTPHAAGTERALAAYEEATEDGEVVRLTEIASADALLELRLHLDDLGLADDPSTGPPDPARTPPTAGEERFYVKRQGSAIGDVMEDTTDCDHGQWGGDCRRKAPRAYKGIAAGEGIAPKALFKCKKCSKNRWRARF